MPLFGPRAEEDPRAPEAGTADLGRAPEAGTVGAAPRPGSAPESALPVSALNALARELLEGHFPPLWVGGEIANWRRTSAGHRYFTLRDESAQVSCVLFRSDARRLPAEPEEGMDVQAFGRVSLYEARGAYQLIVRRLQAGGDGLWRLAFEKLRRRLAAEGLLDAERKRPLPSFPARVGVVTSRSGAALRDVLTVIRRRAPWTHVRLSACRVQGEGAAEDIACAIERLCGRGEVDVLLLARGGGGIEDLWCFNEERVARAVAACPVPVISAVGHETDVTIADLVADVRAPTPSAAAELAVPDRHELAARLRGARARLLRGLRAPVERGEARARRAEERLLGGMARRLERWEARLARAGDRLDALSPLSALRRGYAVPLAANGSVLRAAAAFSEGLRFRLRVVDGTVPCTAGRPEPAPEPVPGAESGPGTESGRGMDPGAAEGG